MGTVTDSNGDTYSVIASWEAVVGYFQEDPPIVTGVASFAGGFTEDGIFLDAGDSYPFTITGNGSSITADDSSGNDYVINIGNSATIDHLYIISKVTGIEKGVQIDIGATHTVSLTRVSASVGYNEGAANVYGFYQVAAPTGSTTNLKYCVANGVYDYGNNSAYGFYHSPPQSEEGEVNVTYCTATDIVSSGTNEAGGMHILASGSSGANLSHVIGAPEGTAYCYSPHSTSNGIRYVGDDIGYGAGPAGAQLLGQSSDRTGLPRGIHGDYDIWGQDGLFNSGNAVGAFKVEGSRGSPYINSLPLDMSSMGDHGEYGAYTYKTRVPCPSNITAELAKLETSGVIPNNSVIIFKSTSYDGELDFNGATICSGSISDIVLEGGVMSSDYHGYGDSMISSSSPRVHAYSQIIYMHNNTWGAAFSGYNMVRSHISSSGNVQYGIYAANANRNSVHGLDNDHGFNTGIHSERGNGQYSCVTFNSIANYKIKGITTGAVLIDNEVGLNFGNLIVQESGQLHPMDNYQQTYRSPNYAANYYASGVSLDEFFRHPNFIGASFDSSREATSINTGNDTYLGNTTSSPPMLWNHPMSYPSSSDEIRADIPKAFEYCDINHNFSAVINLGWFSSEYVSSVAANLKSVSAWSNRFKPSIRGAAIDYGISERADENHGYGNAPIIAFIDF
jgi:hypothetical protein